MPSSASAPRTARDSQDSDIALSARASGGCLPGLPPVPVPEARIRRRRRPPAPVPNQGPIGPAAADLCRPGVAPREVSGTLRPGAAPAVAGTHGSSSLHWVVSTPATRRWCAQSRSLRGQKTRTRSGALGAVRWRRTCVRKRSGIQACDREGRGQSAPGTMSRIKARGARSSLTQRVKASLPCCQQVRSTLTRICWVRAPSQVRFPPTPCGRSPCRESRVPPHCW